MFKRAWNGQEPLWKVWWLIGVPLNLLLIPLLAVLVTPKTPAMVYFGALVPYLLVFFAWIRAAWICAPNVERRVWMILARVVLVFRVCSLAKLLLVWN
ncbi:hypothetical protein D1Y85_12255 [Paraburkholderia dinghuensis]|uniref:Uncharacterized protein n=1 Tax=Paraburkholderia dinghuensis TaxID=2305225 RepID=A0A3N6MS79_9BURK|nr:hypothetical protein D1Y85_12255 [Paraburkholderia dinghuensis]